MIKFRQKDFSNYIVSDAIKGASLGASVGALANGAGKVIPKFKDGKVLTGVGAIIGAALGALVGTVRQVNEHYNRSKADDRLLNPIVNDLLRQGFRENIDFTRDPKTANKLSTKVCLVLNSNGSDFRILVNTVDDPDLKKLTKVLTKKLNSAEVSENFATNKYNEIQISTIKNTKENLRTALYIIKGFIQGGYPTYMVEVG